MKSFRHAPGATALICLELGLKEAPTGGWASLYVLFLLALCLGSASVFIWRSLHRNGPVVDLRNFGDRNFLTGSLLSFVLGMGLFGSVYLMPVFLAFIRGHDALEIGTTMLVTGIAQLITAPIAVALEKRTDPRLLSALGFAVFAVGLANERFPGPALRLRCNVLASGRPGRCDHVLPAAAHAAGPRQSGA